MFRNKIVVQRALILLIISVVVLSGAVAVIGNGITPAPNHFKQTKDLLHGHAKGSENVALTSSVYSSLQARAKQGEPAPMGIADYGINGNDLPYSYTTTSFEGSVKIHSLKTDNASLNGSGTDMTFQLNVNLPFHEGNNYYVYWVQDVAFFNTSSNYISMIDNVWNSSSYNGSVYNSTLQGNGTVGNSSGTLFYYAYANDSTPGNNVTLSDGSTLILMVNATVSSSGSPEIVFEYNDGFGWQIYDNVIISFAKNPTGYRGFMVNGNIFEPSGNYYDAELILGGPGGGYNTYATSANVSLLLEYYNGNNFQMIQNVWNFGSDTAEGISNVSSGHLDYTDTNGTLYEDVRNDSGGVLAFFINSSYFWTLNIHSPLAEGYLKMGNTSTFFTGGDVNVTILPSYYNYTFHFYDVFGNTVKSINYPFADSYLGKTTYTAASGIYAVDLNGSGLASGSGWDVKLSNGFSYASSATSIDAYLSNGSYNYTATSGSQKVSGTFVVSGSNISVTVNFNHNEFPVTFTEIGLPNGTLWGVTLGTALNSTTSSQVTFIEPNGTYRYVVSSVAGYLATPSTGTVTLNGASTSITIAFSVLTYSITFNESGLSAGTTWSVMLAGITETSSTSSITFTEPNGTFSYSVGSVSGYSTTTGAGSVTLDGVNATVNITFTNTNGSVIFNESGLASGTTWTVTINGNALSSTSEIIFNLTYGTYSFSVGSISNYRANEYNGTVSISANSSSVQIVWTVITYPITVSLNGVANGTSWSVTLTGTTFSGQMVNVTESSMRGNVTFQEPNGTYTYSIHLPSGYKSSPGSLSGTTTVAGQSTSSVSVNAQKVQPVSGTQGPNTLIYAAIVIVVLLLLIVAVIVRRGRR